MKTPELIDETSGIAELKKHQRRKFAQALGFNFGLVLICLLIGLLISALPKIVLCTMLMIVGIAAIIFASWVQSR